MQHEIVIADQIRKQKLVRVVNREGRIITRNCLNDLRDTGRNMKLLNTISNLELAGREVLILKLRWNSVGGRGLLSGSEIEFKIGRHLEAQSRA